MEQEKGKQGKTATVIINLRFVCLSLAPLVFLEFYLRSTDYGYEDQLFTIYKDYRLP